MHKRNTSAQGFTIVELLIVIVVIAILAAISVVAYTGIQDRARTSAHRAAASQVERAIGAYAIQNGGDVAISSESLIGYKEGAGVIALLKPLTGTPDITMYGVHESIATTNTYAPFVSLRPTIWGSNSFMLMTSGYSGGPLLYRVDTSAQSNITGAAASGVWSPGNKNICWLQTRNSASELLIGCNQSAPNHTRSITTHSTWGFTDLAVTSPTGDTTHTGLVFNVAHEQATREQVIRWLAQKYAISL